MKIFPHKFAQEDDLADVMKEMFGKYYYTVKPVKEEHLLDMITWCRENGIKMQYKKDKDGFLCRIPEQEYDKLADGESGKYIMYNSNCGYPVYSNLQNVNADDWTSV